MKLFSQITGLRVLFCFVFVFSLIFDFFPPVSSTFLQISVSDIHIFFRMLSFYDIVTAHKVHVKGSVSFGGGSVHFFSFFSFFFLVSVPTMMMNRRFYFRRYTYGREIKEFNPIPAARLRLQ